MVFDSSGSVEMGTFSPFAERTLIVLLPFLESTFFSEDDSFQTGFQCNSNTNKFLDEILAKTLALFSSRFKVGAFGL